MLLIPGRKGVSPLDFKEDDNSYWFAEGVIRKVGSGSHTSSWKNLWLKIIPLKTKFPGLFSNSLQSDGLVGNIASWLTGS